MRVDKFLKISRIIKRRQIAKEACDAGRVSINGSPCKAGSVVKEGDVIEVSFGVKGVKVEVLKIADNAGKSEAAELYRILE
ncbi:MAG: RNA-binding S4 domain-containing protein [Bacillota bacterium]|nr:RNA-binding S4 domain-containing protein [Bacillota bacterium]